MPQQTSSRTATLTIDGKEIELPIIAGTEGELAVDIRHLRAETGVITYDPGLGNTGSCLSAITFLDGEKGILRYAGYPIEELAEHSTFLEVAWLLIHQQLPTSSEIEKFKREITYHTMLHEDLKRFFGSLPKAGHPMAVCAATVGALSTFYQDVMFDDPAEQRRTAAVRLLAKVPTIAGYSYKHSIGQPFNYPRNDLTYPANILYMMFATPCEPYEPDPVVAKALDLLLILHSSCGVPPESFRCDTRSSPMRSSITSFFRRVIRWSMSRRSSPSSISATRWLRWSMRMYLWPRATAR